MLQEGSRVRHAALGFGTIQFPQGELAVVEFDDGGLQRVPLADLQPLQSSTVVAARDCWDAPLPTALRVLGECIVSVNDAWGVFAPSRIDLLPHQLWVCRKVASEWPARWLVADDVGLGKTIEAGLILSSALSRGQVKRVLVLCPASLVTQWQERLFEMFDLRFCTYQPGEDSPRLPFFNLFDHVIASIHTLRLDHRGRRERLLEAPPWDLVIVDEAHHLNRDEQMGATQTFSLVQDLCQAGRVGSMLFFTGTPHRGKDFNFFSLLELLRPDLFSASRPVFAQLPLLGQAMIRNNKYSVTNLKGEKLFQEPLVRQETYRFSPAEAEFYERVSDFIQRGLAYSRTLDQTRGQAVQLVLVAIQKLASSSVAAVLRALRRRVARVEASQERRSALAARLEEARALQDEGRDEELSAMEEELFDLSREVPLMEQELPYLRDLIQAGERIVRETKIERLVEVLDGPFAGRPVLLFTEYKATQACVMEALHRRFGQGCCTFINGDEALEGTSDGARGACTVRVRRSEAAAAFNAGRVRFLLSTEAGGEGIDLQEQCHSLIHIDLPWNPMRLHQRVGRLNRYGQTRQVEVILMTNPETVESRIWEILNEKISAIGKAFESVMEEPEDLFPLVLGMTAPGFFPGLFSEATTRARGLDAETSLRDWFDSRTATFGGQDMLKTVRELVGSAARFRFQDSCAQIPRVDLGELKPFLLGMLRLHRRRVQEQDGGLSFVTPEPWLALQGVRRRFDGLHFDRSRKDARTLLAGVGTRVLDAALQEARGFSGVITALPALQRPLLVFRVQDQVTVKPSAVRFSVVAVEVDPPGGHLRLLRDWEVILALCAAVESKEIGEDGEPPTAPGPLVEECQKRGAAFLSERFQELDLPFQAPKAELLATLWPRTQE